MKKISLIALATAMVLSVQFAKAQDNDTSKNKIDVKKKVKTGVHGRQVTKIKVQGKGTPEALNKAAATATTEKTQVITRPAPTSVVVVNQQPQAATTQAAKPAPTTQSTKITSSHTHVIARKSRVRHVHHKPGVTTTTTTTVKKE